MGRLKRSESEADKADWAVRNQNSSFSPRQFHSKPYKTPTQVIKQWSLSVGYSPYKSTSSNRVPTGTLVVVHSQSSNQDTPDTGESVLLSYAPALRAILVEHATSYPLPPLILVLDLSQIVSDEKIDQETMMVRIMNCWQIANQQNKSKRMQHANRFPLLPNVDGIHQVWNWEGDCSCP